MELSTKAKEIVSAIEPLAPKGYAIGLHVRFSTPSILLQTYDPEWTEIYTANGYIMSDPTVHWGFTNTGACRWSDIESPDPEDVMGKSAAFGLKYGITVACDVDGSKSISSFARDDREFSDEEIATIDSLMRELHMDTAKDLS